MIAALLLMCLAAATPVEEGTAIVRAMMEARERRVVERRRYVLDVEVRGAAYVAGGKADPVSMHHQRFRMTPRASGLELGALRVQGRAGNDEMEKATRPAAVARWIERGVPVGLREVELGRLRLTLAGEERLEGRPTYRILVSGAWRGRLWIDTEELQLVRYELEAELGSEEREWPLRMRRVAWSGTYERREEGVWLPKRGQAVYRGEGEWAKVEMWPDEVKRVEVETTLEGETPIPR